jgi:putative heme-binding domain-containing protein
MSCHTLFDVGRHVGPDLTGSNRKDLEYLLSNIVDPSAEVAKEYQVTTIWMDDGGVVDGIVATESAESITVKTATSEVLVLRSEIAKEDDGTPSIRRASISMMPEDQLAALTETEIGDLLAYLGSDQQVAARAEPRILPWFFSGRDLNFFDADPSIWSVENGELVGRTTKDLKQNSFARSHFLFSDFRLTLQFKLVRGAGNSGVQFRSEVLPGGDVRGYQADIGSGYYGSLYEEHGRGTLAKGIPDQAVKVGEWNHYEIVAVGDRILMALNGKMVQDLTDAPGRRHGILAFQVHSGPPMEVRFRNFQLELDPKPVLNSLSK